VSDAGTAAAAGFADRLAGARQRIAAVRGDADAVELVAVTKGHGADAVRLALEAGIDRIGENYAAELLAKDAELGTTPRPHWHFLGAVQRNKVGRLAPLVSCWQGIARIEEGRSIARQRPGACVLVEVDLTGATGRGGIPATAVPALVAELRTEDLDVAGLMAVGVPGPPEASRAGFRQLASLADDLGLPVRSMGMSDDLEVALEEGSTMVRLGRALFGGRPAPSTRPGGQALR
jgi:PLP dependent protein